jgi:hypothetical protein
MSQPVSDNMTKGEIAALKIILRKVELALAYSAGVLTVMAILAIRGAWG